MEKVFKLYKNLGETPLECMERFRAENPEYAEEKMTYAGRLDPMAEGLLIVLVGEECKKKDEYLGLDKEYIFEVLFGITTDTYDILGIPQENYSNVRTNVRIDLEKFLGKRVQEYPAYSSRTFQMARDGVDFEPPTKEVEIFDIEMLEEREIDKETLQKEILERIDLVKGDFRQEETKNAWKNILENAPEKFRIAKFRINCSSGTYVRSICNELGGLAYSIKRTRVGNYLI
jgi:tRNA pseudouridine(55) synthase